MLYRCAPAEKGERREEAQIGKKGRTGKEKENIEPPRVPGWKQLGKGGLGEDMARRLASRARRATNVPYGRASGRSDSTVPTKV